MVWLSHQFDFQPMVRVIFGAGSINQLGVRAAELGRRVLLVTDRGIRSAGHVDRACDLLKQAGLDVAVFEGVVENPTTREVGAGLQVAQAFQPDLLVGLGGGSSLDTAKGMNFLYTNGGQMADYWGIGKASKPMLPMIAIPTTAGTGSEAQSFALIADENSHRKMACGDKKATCKLAILDPEVTVSQPAKVTALVGIDAISHAVETAVTKKRNAVSTMFSAEAWRLMSASFSRVLKSPDDLDARGMMLLGAHYAGLAIENSMLGLTHALANPLTANFGITHGAAIGLMLPHVVRFNAEQVADQYQILNSREQNGTSPSVSRLLDQLFNWLSECNLPTRLSDYDIPLDRLPALAEQASKEWTGTFNPRSASLAELQAIYQSAS